MYTIEFAEFILSRQGNFRWHIYSYNLTKDAASYLEGLNSPWIKLFGGVNYEALPAILQNYDIGVILYKGHIPNYIHNAPNKLFEYLACGLEVWYPDVMEGINSFKAETNEAAVTALDFKKLSQFNWQPVVIKPMSVRGAVAYTCEIALDPLVKILCR